MKSNLLALLGSAVGFATGGLITYKLLNRRRTSGSFRELYEDNADKNSDPDNIYTNGEFDSMCYEFLNQEWLWGASL